MYRQVDPRFALFVDDVVDESNAPRAQWLLDGFIRSIRRSAPPTSPPGARRQPTVSQARRAGDHADADDVLLRRACAASAYSIDADLLHAALREAQRFLYAPLPGTPPWPALPLWLEWGGCALGGDPDEQAEPGRFAITSLFAWRARAGVHALQGWTRTCAGRHRLHPRRAARSPVCRQADGVHARRTLGHRADWAMPASDVHERAAHHERTGRSRPGLRL